MRCSWEQLYNETANCRKCCLCEERNNVVVGIGKADSDIMFIGEGPGRDEDIQGIPFVGAAGQLLDKMLASIGLSRDKNVYIANIVKCRPPQNRNPLPDEAQACIPYLREQFALVRPKVIVCLGAVAGKYIYDENIRITKDHGNFTVRNGVYIIATYHPAALLRDQAKKRESWNDLQLIRAKCVELGIL